MKCYVCETELIHEADSDEIANDEHLITTTLVCPHCKAHHEVTWNGGEVYEWLN